jgi:hypothetical protein
MRTLDGAVKSLVEGVGAVGLFFPAKTVEMLESAKRDSEAFHETEARLIREARTAADKSAAASESSLQVGRAANSAVAQLEQSLDSVRGTLEVQGIRTEESQRTIKEVLELVERVKSEARASNRTVIDLIKAIDSEQSRSDGALPEQVRIPQLAPSATDLKKRNEPPESATQPFEYAYTHNEPATPTVGVTRTESSLDGAMQDLLRQVNVLASVIPEIAEEKNMLAKIEKRLQRFDSVVRWHQRAARAPLMRLMLLQFGSRGISDGNA